MPGKMFLLLASRIAISVVTIGGVTLPAHAATPAEPAVSVVEDFIRAGAGSVLKGCNMLAHVCGDEAFRTLEKGYGESDEGRRNWRKMELGPLTVTATYPVQDTSRYYIEQVSMNGPGWPVPEGLDIGQPKARVAERLGPPTRSNANKCDVYFSEAQVASATFCFRDGQISTISWEYLVD